MAHKIFEFNDTQYDDHFTSVSFTEDQYYPSPELMRKYELCNYIPSTKVFIEHSNMKAPEGPDMTGKRV